MFDCSVDLPLLKTLDLYFVRFECIEDFMKLLSGCPILENLKTLYVKTTAYFDNEGYIDPMYELMEAEIDSLIHLFDADLNDIDEDLKRKIKRKITKLILGCLMLEDVKTVYVDSSVGVTAGGYSKPCLSKLIKADIHLFDVPLRGISGVQFLTLTGMGKSLPNEEINTYYKGFSVFKNLIELQLFWSNHFVHDWNEVVTMLQNCPKLQNLSISKCRNSTTTEDWKYPFHVPKCVSSHLTTCKIIDYEPVEADFRFATYILQNANLLQVMEIHCPFTPKAMTSPKFIEDLITCPRISPACKLSLE
ncbi:hypothetical protein P8452_47780 [Trifolium repens]|nr:hypothetical protein P8452_47780 [Trifolium repens]